MESLTTPPVKGAHGQPRGWLQRIGRLFAGLLRWVARGEARNPVCTT